MVIIYYNQMSLQSTTGTEKQVVNKVAEVDELDEDLFSSEQKAELKKMKDLESKVEEKLENLENPIEGKINTPKFDKKIIDDLLKNIKNLPKNQRNAFLSNLRNNISVNQEKQQFSTVSEYNKNATSKRLKQIRENLQNSRKSKQAQMYQEKKQENKNQENNQKKIVESEQSTEIQEKKEQ
jgi:hypothetical protein